MEIPADYPKISKENCKKYFKCVKNMTLFYNNAEELLNDAEILLSKKGINLPLSVRNWL